MLYDQSQMRFGRNKMMWKYLLGGLILFGVMTLFGCTADSGPDYSEGKKAKMLTVVTVSDADNGKTIKVWEDDELVVKLQGNRSTGYMWMKPRNWDGKGILEQIGTADYCVTKMTNGKVGSGGTSTWRFRGERPGKADIELEYRRPWEEQDASKKFVLHVEVVRKIRIDN